MSALIQQIDNRSVHHLQSGQVINDGLSSAVKELVENALDAHATSIEVRFKNYGLDSIEAIDNGDGIAPENHESVALKHYTSKLRTYSDLESVTTFGFRGEALSSLCALSDLHIITATVADAPKGTKLELESSGKLKNKTLVAASKGTTVFVKNLFKTLPVRRRELERNIKRDYSKVLGYLQAYASICVGVKFSVSNQPAKGKKTPAFATKGNPTTRENISNVFGSKTLLALVSLDLEFKMRSTQKPALTKSIGQGPESREVKIVGHISRPVVGEGRNAPDRQMFFVNGRPCVLPQISKAFNEVYKGFNVTQSPFIFADLQLDTNAYDVNVSPDKRTILLHDQAELLENLKMSLTELFESHKQTVPVNKLGFDPKYQQTSLHHFSSPAAPSPSPLRGPRGQWMLQGTAAGSDPPSSPIPSRRSRTPGLDEEEEPPELALKPTQRNQKAPRYDLSGSLSSFPKNASLPFKPPMMVVGRPSSGHSTTADGSSEDEDSQEDSEGQEEPHSPMREMPAVKLPSNSQPSPFRSAQRRLDAPATITIGDRAPVTTGGLPGESPRKKRKVEVPRNRTGSQKSNEFTSALGKFMAPGTQAAASLDDDRRKGSLEEDVEDSEEDLLSDLSEGNYEQRASQGVAAVESLLNRASPVPDVNLDLHGSLVHDVEPGPETAPAERMDTDGPPLFGPNTETCEDPEEEHGLERGSVEGLEGVEDAEEVPASVHEDGDEYLPEAEEQGQARAKARAARLLKQAEQHEATRPTEEILARNFRILSNSRKHSTLSTVRFEKTSLERIKESAKCLRDVPSSNSPSTGGSDDPLDTQDETAEQRLTLTVSKEDFLKMDIHGQFNKGFIITTRGSELFIIDQHASDEKYNFETLQATTVVQNQPLVVPRPLDLMAMDEIAVTDNLDVFKKNGFVVDVDPEAPTGKRCKLVSLPMSKETVFGVEDLEELIHLIHSSQGSGTSHLRCSKVRSMFAMRACRKSVMVGKALPVKAMEKIVRHMGELDKPWNCPHGRPTMRHLAELGGIETWSETNEKRGGGGLKWDSETWKETLADYVGDGF